ncbi:MAG: MFS transporter [Nanoarchaeota archaeon]
MVENEGELKAKARKISIIEGSACSVMDGFGSRYITPYALALGANNTHIGFLSSIPSLIGDFSQLCSIRLIKKVPRKKIVFFGVLLQALMWLGIIFAGSLFFLFNLSSNLVLILLIFIYSCLIICGGFVEPIWNSWMKDIVPEKSAAYFGKRTRICNSIALTSMLIAGFILDYFKQTKIFLGFIILFFIAFIFRSVSALLFLKKYEPQYVHNEESYFSFRSFLKKIHQNNFGKFVIYVALIQFATAIASPFFSVYALKYLEFTYTQYTIMIMAPIIASILLVSSWGKFANKYGNSKVLKICGSMIWLIPFLWMFSPLIFILNKNLAWFYIILVEGFSGSVWAGFNLSSSNFIYDAVTKDRIAYCFTYFNILGSIGTFIGAMIGGFISSSNFVFFGLSSILLIFLFSSIMRFSVFLIMAERIKEVREVEKFDFDVTKYSQMIKKILRPRCA